MRNLFLFGAIRPQTVSSGPLSAGASSPWVQLHVPGLSAALICPVPCGTRLRAFYLT